MTDKFKNRLLFSLLGDEAISSFACLPEALSMDTMTLANFHKAAKVHFQPITSPIHAYFDFQSRQQQEGETVSQFRNALCSLLVDCEVGSEEERKRLFTCQLVFGCRDSSTLQKLLALRVFDLESIFSEMESQEKATDNAKAIHGGGSTGRVVVGAVQRGRKKSESHQTASNLNQSGASGQGK